MADMNVNYINPFLEAAIAIVKDACQVELKIGKPYAKMVELTEGTVVILIGVTGEMRGQVVLSIDEKKACEIASRMMMGMPVPELDDMAISAISELGNMIMGNAATVFSVRYYSSNCWTGNWKDRYDVYQEHCNTITYR